MVANRFPADIVVGRVVEVVRSDAELYQEAIVQAAGCPYVASSTTPVQAKTREVALDILLRLSTNACNRRLLAKHRSQKMIRHGWQR